VLQRQCSDGIVVSFRVIAALTSFLNLYYIGKVKIMIKFSNHFTCARQVAVPDLYVNNFNPVEVIASQFVQRAHSFCFYIFGGYSGVVGFSTPKIFFAPPITKPVEFDLEIQRILFF